MVDEERIRARLADTEAYLADVVRIRDGLTSERFVAERDEQYRLFFPLQQAIQGCLDLAAHWLAGEPGRQPPTLAALFEALAERALISAELASRLAAMARFRNLLVHEYGRVKADEVWILVNTRLGDIAEFLTALARRIEA